LEWEPWVVRHLYTTADRQIDAYLSTMQDLLHRAQKARWISTVRDKPIETRDDIAAALRESTPGELVIMDLHGAVDEAGAWLGPHAEQPGFNLREIPTDAWSAAAVVLTNCEGAQRPFQEEVRRINTRPVALVGHFGIARMRDHTPVTVVNEILHQADGGDEGAAFKAAWATIGDPLVVPNELWAAELLKP
jgi:hypothetical protein